MFTKGHTIRSTQTRTPTELLDHWYVPEDAELFGFKACKHRITKELALFGKYGEVWDRGQGKAGIMVYGRYTQTKGKIKRFLGECSPTKGDQSELNLVVDTSDIPAISALLKIPDQPGRQLTWKKKNSPSEFNTERTLT